MSEPMFKITDNVSGEVAIVAAGSILSLLLKWSPDLGSNYTKRDYALDLARALSLNSMPAAKRAGAEEILGITVERSS